jgi:aldose 1-epimerase
MALAPSGQQFEIGSGRHHAVLVEVGGGIREYRNGGRPVLDGYPAEEIASGARGTPLIPWPNRLADGNYHYAGSDYQLDLTEPKAHNAIHGLTRWRSWTAREHGADRLVLGIMLHPTPGYPFPLDVEIEYTLGPTGLTVATTATNLGERPCPYGTGQHPYLNGGPGLIDGATLAFDAKTWIPTDDRGLPIGRQPVAGSELDFSGGRPIGDTVLDHAFTDLRRDADGLAWLRLTAPDGSGTRLWMDQHYGFMQLYSGDTQRVDRRRLGLAVEPMTCPANSFRSGDGLVELAPGKPLTTRWGIRSD